MKLSQSDQILSANISSASRQHRQDCRSCFGRSARRRRDSVYFDFFAFVCSSNARSLALATRLLLKLSDAIQRRSTETSGYFYAVKISCGQIAVNASITPSYDIWRLRCFGSFLRCGWALTNDLAFLHDEGNARGRSYVGGRITRHGNDIGQFPFFLCAEFLIDTAELGVACSRRF